MLIKIKTIYIYIRNNVLLDTPTNVKSISSTLADIIYYSIQGTDIDREARHLGACRRVVMKHFHRVLSLTEKVLSVSVTPLLAGNSAGKYRVG